MGRLIAILGLIFLVEGCYTTTVRVDSIPQGAEVHYDYEPKGVTPTEFDVLWYGEHRLTLDHPDYEQRVEVIDLHPPAYLYFPLDFMVAIMPFHVRDVQEFTVDLNEPPQEETEETNHGTTGEKEQQQPEPAR